MSTSESRNLNPIEQKVGHEEVDLTITDAIPIGISVLTPDGTTIYVNPRGLDDAGITLDQVKSKGLLERICHPDDLDPVLGQRRRGLSQGVPFELEMRLLLKNGEYRWHLAQYNPLTDESGKIIRWYLTAIDIDDRKRAEEMLQKSEEDLRTITDTVRQPIVVLAPDATTLYANRVALDITGLTISEVTTGGFLTRACHPDDVDRVLNERSAGLSKGIPFDSEARISSKNGHYRWLLLQYNPLKDERGQIVRWYATATDINDQKKTEERLRNENLVLRE